MASNFSSALIVEEAQRVFEELDLDKNKVLTLDELRTGLAKLSLPCSDKDLQHLMVTLDTNKDGHISLDEFVDFYEAQNAALRTIFAELNPSSDHLPVDDVELAIKRLGHHVHEDQLLTLIRHMDTDGDQNVSFSEFLKYMLLVPQASSLNVLDVFDHWSRINLAEHPSIAHHDILSKDSLSLLLAGAVAGGVSRTCTAPLERLKTLQQAGVVPGGANLGPSVQPRIGVISGLSRIYAHGGFRAFFRGNGANVVKIAPDTALKMMLFDRVKTIIAKDPSNVTGGEKLFAGGIAGGFAQCVVFPLDTIKTRLAASPAGTYRGIVHCATKMFQTEGPFALYRGLSVSLVGIFPYAGVDLAIYNSLKEFYLSKYERKRGTPIPTLAVIACAATSATCGQVASYPFALVRTKLQLAGLGNGFQYTGMGDCFKRTVAEQGYLGLYRGIKPCLMKLVPATAISYSVFERVYFHLKSML